MKQNALFPVVLGQPIDCIPFTVVLEHLTKIIKRTFGVETHLVFQMDSGEAWSLYPKQLQGSSPMTTKFILHRIQEAMGRIQKPLLYEEQVLIEKKIGCSSHASWQTVINTQDHE